MGSDPLTNEELTAIAEASERAQRYNDAVFIAGARQWVPRLVAEVSALRSELRIANERGDGWRKEFDRDTNKIAALRSEVEVRDRRINELTEALSDRTRELVTLENAAHDVVNEWGTRDEDWIRPTFDGAIDRLRGVLAAGGDNSNPPTPDVTTAIAKAFHDEYEGRAAATGWETQRSTRVEWNDLPIANKTLMRSTVDALLRRRVILAADGSFPEPTTADEL